MKILITGLNGFTGQYLAPALQAQGHEVLGLKSDLRDESALNQELKQEVFDAVIHLAAVAFVAHQNPNQFYEVNSIGTRNLLQAVQDSQSHIQTVILASSASVYGNQTAGSLSESHVPQPANDYAVSKLTMEHIGQLFSKHLPICITRPFNYTGVGQAEHFLVPKIVQHFKLKKTEIELGNLDVWREFGDVRQLASFYIQLLNTPQQGIWNLCTGKAHALSEILDLCQSLSGHHLLVKQNPAFMRANEVKILKGDARKINSLMGKTADYSLKDTLTWMLNTDL